MDNNDKTKMVRLMTDQIVDLWDSIRYGIICSIEPMVKVTPEIMHNILCKLIRDEMQCWCVFSGDKDIYGYVITSINEEINAKEKTLIIYSLFLYKGVNDMEIWKESYGSIEKFAKANGCDRITAYSANSNVISLAEKMGFSSDCRFLVKEVT